MHICTHACVCVRLLWRNTILLRLLCFYLVFSLLGEAFKRQKGAHSVLTLLPRTPLGLEVSGQPAEKKGSRTVWVRWSHQQGMSVEEGLCSEKPGAEDAIGEEAKKLLGAARGRMEAAAWWHREGGGRSELSGREPQGTQERACFLCALIELEDTGPAPGTCPKLASCGPWIFTVSCSWVLQGMQNITEFY